jgi:hypothetical protein
MTINVESRVTTSHLRDSSSTEINERNMTITIESKVTASHLLGRGSTEINDRNMTITIQSEVTASHLLGSGSTKINDRNMTINIQSEVTASRGSGSTEISNPKQGFQHVYKLTKVTSSLQVHAAHKATLMNGAPQNKIARRRDQRKQRKIDSLQQVQLSPTHMLNTGDWISKPMFFSGTSNRILPNPVMNSHFLSAVTDLKVVDTVDSVQMKSDNGDTVFVLIP